MVDSTHPEVLLVVTFKSSLPPDELEKRYQGRIPEYRKVPGLLQKYYLHDPSSGEWGGFYLWDSQASLDAFMTSDLRRSIPDVYQIVGTPRVDTHHVVEVLRPERT